MAVVKDKYRGTTTYLLVYSELVTAARYCGVTTYQRIAALMGLPPQGSHMGAEVGHILGEISEDERAQGRPMLSAAAVGASGKPGPGFFSLAVEFGMLEEGTAPEVQQAFWQQQREKVYAAWND